MANRYVDPVPHYDDENGLPQTGGTLTFYLTGSSTPASIYSDKLLATPADNPQTLDELGNTPDEIFLDPSITYKVVLTDADGVVVWTRDPVVDPAANISAAIQVYAGNPNTHVAGNAGTVGGVGASVVWDITNHLLYVCTTTGVAAAAVWTQVAAVLSGSITFSGTISPTALAADTNNYAPTGFSSAYTVRLNASGAISITGLAGGADGRFVQLLNYGTFPITLASENASSTAGNRFTLDGDVTLAPSQSIILQYDGSSARWRPVGRSNVEAVTSPGGRLTLTSATPVLSTDVASATTVYFTPYMGFFAPLWNGVGMSMANLGSELSVALDSNSGHTGYHQSGKLFDFFVYKDGTTIRLVSGPAWSSSTARTTALEYKNGFLVNAASMTARFGSASGNTVTVPQDYGLYVGTVSMSADGTTKWLANPAAAAGGGNCQLLVWNTYNRVSVCAASKDSTNSWTQGSSAWRAADNNTANRVTLVIGLSEDSFVATYNALHAGGQGVSGIGYDTAVALSGSSGTAMSATGSGGVQGVTTTYSGVPGLGLHFFQAVENIGTYYGDNSDATTYQMMLSVMGRM